MVEADVDKAFEKGSRCENDGLRPYLVPGRRDDTRDGSLFRQDAIGRATGNIKPALRAQRLLHGFSVQFLIALHAKSPDGRTLAGVDHLELNAGAIGIPAHFTAKRIDLFDEMALGDSTNGRIAGHLRDLARIHGEQHRSRAHTSRSERRLTSGMTPAHNDDVVGFHSFSLAGTDKRFGALRSTVDSEHLELELNNLILPPAPCFGLFAYTKLGKDMVQNIIRRRDAGDITKRIKRSPEIHCNEFRRQHALD